MLSNSVSFILIHDVLQEVHHYVQVMLVEIFESFSDLKEELSVFDHRVWYLKWDSD